MKKIILLCAVLFVFSCSNDHEINFKEQEAIGNSTTAARQMSVIENEIDEVFYEYFNSQEYLNAHEAIVLFNSKVNNSYAIKNSKNKFELFNWINNILIIRFSSYSSCDVCDNKSIK